MAVDAARASTKSGDLGATRAEFYSVSACIEFETAPTDGGMVQFFWAPSPSATAATGNPGGITGTDAAFTETVGNMGQLQRVGLFKVRNNVINIGYVGVFSPLYRYGSLLVVNNASTAFRSSATAADESHIVMTPIIPDIQAAA